MLAKWLNTIGLALGMAGVVMLFIWGPPSRAFRITCRCHLWMARSCVTARGSPTHPLRWTIKSTYRLAEVLRRQGYRVSATSVRRMLAAMGYSLQSNLAYNETSTSWKTPVDVVPDSAILDWEADSLSNADFLKKENDPALKETGWEK